MYVRHFGLSAAPFTIAPDPRYLFLSERHREALAHLLYGLGGGGGIVLLTGEIGAGKTTVCRAFLEQVPPDCRVAYVFNPKLSVVELLTTICEEFGVAHPPPETATVKTCVDPLNAFLLARHAAGEQAVLVIDEAQNLDPAVLEQLRLLTNLETAERKLLQIILIGQPELRAMLARPGLEQLAQRVIARYHLGPLDPAETRQYLAHRLAVAGAGAAPIFEPAALRALHRHSGGVPRRINLLADRALLAAYAAGRATVDRRRVEQAAAEVFDPAGARPAGRGRPIVLSLALGLGLAGGLALGALLGGPERTAPPAGAGVEAVDVAAAGIAGRSPGPAASAAAPAASVADAADAAASSPTLAAGETMAPTADRRDPAASAAGSTPDAGVPGASADPPPVLPLRLADLAPALPRSAARRSDGEDAAWAELAALWPGAPPAPGADAPTRPTCLSVAERGLRCQRLAGDLAALRQLDRPGLLQLRVDGQAATLLLIGLGPQRARLQRGGRTVELPVERLAAHWDGQYATLWTPPPGYRGGPLSAGSDPAGAWLMARLRSLPGATLDERIRRFQAAQGLPADGLAGPVTLMQLHRLSGEPAPRLQPLD